jgi:hypothetical protein
VSLTHGAPVNVAPFQNDSLEADAAIIAQRAAGHALAEHGGTIATAGGSYDLRGRVERVVAIPAGIGWWRVEARVRLELVDPSHPDHVIAHSVVSDQDSYRTSSDASSTEAARRLSTDRVLQKILSAGVERLAP